MMMMMIAIMVEIKMVILDECVLSCNDVDDGDDCDGDCDSDCDGDSDDDDDVDADGNIDNASDVSERSDTL